MKPKTIGIVGGAGPMASSYLLEKIIRLAGKDYGCVLDGDFPKLVLISFPFSDMLTSEKDAIQVQNELSNVLNELYGCGAEIVTIACNTLHAFLDQGVWQKVISLPESLIESLEPTDIPLVLCTTTSRAARIHKTSFTCDYPDLQTQSDIDQLILDILNWKDEQEIVFRLQNLINQQEAKTFVLGCTELSLLSSKLNCDGKKIIDPLEIVAKKLLELSFEKEWVPL